MAALALGAAASDPKARLPERDIDTIAEAGNTDPMGLWSDATTLWVVDNGDNHVYAYRLADGERDADRDIEAASAAPATGLWSDGETLWVLGYYGGATAYVLATAARDAGKDLPGLGGAAAVEMWSDGETAWVVRDRHGIVEAHGLATGARAAERDVVLDAANGRPAGLWSDGTTLWVADTAADRLFGYSLQTGARLPETDFDTLSAAGNVSPRGLWSDGGTLWVADWSANKAFAYRHVPTGQEARLASLAVTGAELSFDPEVLDHAATVGPAFETVAVEAQAEDMAASVLIEPADADRLLPGHQVDLAGGAATVTVQVAADGRATRTYRLALTRTLSADARLGALSVDGVAVRLDAEATAYAVSVANATATVSVAATAYHGAATAGVGGTDADAEAPGHQVDLSVGDNAVSVKVTAEDGTARTVVLTVTRLPADGDARLSSLTIGAADLGFHPDVMAYAVAVPFATGSVTVVAEPADGTSVAAIAGQDDDPDRPEHQAALTVGATTVSVTVTAADGTVRTYTVTVTRTPASADARLTRLALSGVDLAFDPGTTAYAADVAYAVATVTVSAAAGDSRARVAVAPADGDPVAAGHQIALAVGANAVTTTVTAEDGTTRAYAVTVTRAAASDDASLASLAVSGADLAFDAAVTEYAVEVSYYAELATVSAGPTHPAATATVAPADAGPAAGHQVALAVGSNAIDVTVTSEDGSTRSYSVSVRRKAASETAELPEHLSQDVLLEFIEARGIRSVEAVVEALPPLHRRHFVAVHGSHSPVADFVSTSHPRIVSWGADAQFIMTWTTNDDDHPFREGLEFLEARPDEGRWVAGVVDFSGDAPELKHPAACAGCHGDIGKPLWGSQMWEGTEDESPVAVAGAEELALYATMADATHPRLVPLEREAYRRTSQARVVRLPYDSVEANYEFSAMLAGRHAQVLFARLRGREDYDEIAESLVCGGHRKRILGLFDQADFAPHRLSGTGEHFQGRPITDQERLGDYNDNSLLTDRVALLAFHDLWRDDASVGGVYRWTSNDFGRTGQESRYAPGAATMEDELVAAYREFYSLRGQALIDARRVRIGRLSDPKYATSFVTHHVLGFYDQVCAAARSRTSPLFGPASVVAGFTLVNAAADADAGRLADGAVRMPAGEPLTIRAEVPEGAGIASVGFELRGPLSVERMASGGPPFALFGASHGDYAGRTLPPGAYRVTATPYSRAWGGGERGPALTVGFTVAPAAGRAPAHDVEGLAGAGNAAPGGVWSDGDTLMVVDRGDARIYAYGPGGTRRSGADMALSADNAAPGGAWSDGALWWVTDTDDSKVYAYGADGGRVPARDIGVVGETGSGTPTAVWSDGDTIWVAEREDARLYAYALADGRRRPLRDIGLDAGNAAPAGMWGDGLTVWVSDTDAGRLFAYALAGAERDASRDVDTAAAGNARPTGIWSDGDVLWAGDADDAKLYAYELPEETRLRGLAVDGEPVPLEEHVFDYRVADVAYVAAPIRVTATPTAGSTAVVAGAGAHGRVALAEGENTIRIAVTDDGESRTYTLRVRRALATESTDARLATLTLSGVDLGFSGDVLDYAARVRHAVDAVDLDFRTESAAAVAVAAPADGDGAAPGHQIVLGYGEERAWTSATSRVRVTVTVTAEDRANVRTYTVALRRSHRRDSDAQLRSLAFAGVDPLGFARGTYKYAAQAAYMPESTLRAEPVDSAASIAIDPEDASDRSGHQVALAAGDNRLAVTVTSADGLVKKTYAVQLEVGPPTVVRQAADDILVVNRRGTDPYYLFGIWSDGQRLWVAADFEVLEFDLAAKAYRGKYATSWLMTGFWSAGEELWGTYSHSHVRKADPSSPDHWVWAFDTEGVKMSVQRDLWSDGENFWIVLNKIAWGSTNAHYNRPAQLHAVDMTGAAQPEQSFQGLERYGNWDPRGIWSDGETVWLTDDAGAKVYAYALHTWERRSALDLNVLEAAGNTNPRGIWSDGATMWILDSNARIYAYTKPVAAGVAGHPTTLCGRTGGVRVAVMAALRASGTIGQITPCGEVTAAQLASVETLDLRRRSPMLRAGDLVGLTGLVSLDLGGNGLGELPPGALAGMVSLRRLELDGNGLDADDLAILTDLASLEELGLADNALAGEFVPAWFTGTPALTRLDLSGNGLIALPSGAFAGLPGLRELRLDDNALTELPSDAFSGLGQLKVLTLGDNGLTALLEATFAALTALDTLDISGNALAELPAGLFGGWTSLTALDLSKNALSELPDGVFAGLTALDTLDISGNALAELPAGLFDGLRSLTALDLSKNALSKLPDGVFAGLTALDVLVLSDNATKPLEIAVSVEKTGDVELRATVAAGAPFALTVPVEIAGGKLSAAGGALAVATGATASATAVITLDAAGDGATAQIGDLPELPEGHSGYVLSKSGEALAFTPPVLPGPPTALAAQALGVAAIGLSWAVPDETGASALTGYRIEASADGGETWTELSTVAAEVTEHVHGGLPPGSTRDYQVYATNGNGTGIAATARATTRVAAVSITGPTEAVAEGGPAEFALSRTWPDGAPALAVTVAVAGEGLASAAGERSVAFGSGAATTALAVATRDDKVVGARGPVTATVMAGDGYTVAAGASAEAAVEDSDVATFTVTASPSGIEEGDAATVTVSIANGVTFAAGQTVTLAASGTAAAEDYTLDPTPLTLAAGATSVSATLTATDDEAEESAETVTLTASHGGTEIGTATVSIAANDAPAPDDATLDALTLSGIDIGTFDASITDYSAEVTKDVDSTTVTAMPTNAEATVRITDGDGSTVGTTRTVSLAEGANEITATVTSADGEATRTYTVTVTRSKEAWGDRRPEQDIALDAVSRPTGIWGSAETLWIAAWGEYDVYAYDFAGNRVPDEDLRLGSGGFPNAMWSDGTTLWMADHFSGVQGHSLADGSRVADEDFGDATSTAGNDAPNGLWSDGTTMRVADRVDGDVYAYALSDKARRTDAEFSLGGVETFKPFGLWSDGEVVLSASWHDGKVHAFRMADGGVLPALEIDTGAAGNTRPFGLWSAGDTLWVVDDAAQKLFAYAVPGLGGDGGEDEAAEPVEVSIAADASPVSEGTAAAFTLTRTGAAAGALTVAVSVSERGAMASGALPSQVTFAAAVSTASLSVATTDDAVVEASSTVTAALTPGSGYAVAAEGGSAEVVVEDDDAATFGVELSAASVAEGASATLTVSVTNAVTFAEPQTIGVAASGTAAAADYALSVAGEALSAPYELTLAAGASSTVAMLSATDDAVTEAEETVTLTASHGGAQIGTATVTIPANDTALLDDATLAALTLSGLDIGTFDAATADYTATAAESVAETAVTATANDSGASVAIEDADGSTAGTTRDVALGYGANTVTVTVTAADGETKKTYTVTVTRAYTLPTATIAAGTSPVAEGTAASFTVRLDKAAKDALSVAVTVTETGAMLSGTASSVAMAVGVTEATLNLGTADDSVVEDAGTVTATLAAGDGYTVGATDSAEVSVTDGDAATFAVAAAPSAIEEGDSTTVTVSIANGVTFAAEQTVTLTASGTAATGDYTLDPTTLTLGAGESSVWSNLTATDDEAEESAETVTLTARHGGTAIGTVTVTIAANDTALLDDATLAALTLSGLDIGTFDAATADYTATAAESVAETTVTATPTDADATVTISDVDGSTAGTTRNVALGYGTNTITAAVTAADGETTTAYTVTVTRARARAPLTASLHDVPEWHDGTGEIEFELRLSEEIGLSYQTLRAGYEVEGGTLLWTRRMAPPGNVRWRVGVQPEGGGEVVATLPGNQPCGTAGAVCAADGRMLSNSPAARIPGPLPVVSIAADGSPVSEGTAAAFTLTRTGDAAAALTVAVSVSESGAMVLADAPTEATFAVGAATAALAIATMDDAVVEASSTVTAAVASVTGHAVAVDGGSAEVLVEDDDTATFAVALSAETVAEGASATLTVSVADGVTFAEAQTIGIAASGTASAADYALLVDGAALSAPYAMTLAAGAGETAATLSATDDAETEAEEIVTLTASHDGAAIGTATATIPANDAPLSDDATLSGLTLSGIGIGTFDRGTTDYAATAAEALASTTVTATAGDAEATVTITDSDGNTTDAARVVDLDYGANTISATVTAADGHTTKTYTVTVTRAYTLPAATIAAGTSPVTEGAAASFTVQLDKPAKDALTVAVTVAETGAMLSGTASSVAMAVGVTESTLNLGTVDDSVVEDASTVTVALAAGDGYTVGAADSAEASVADDDVATFAVAAAPSAIEEGDAATVTVSVANGVTFAAEQTVTLTASGTAAADDYTLSATSLTLAAGDAAVSATLTATDDEAEESAETVTLTASHGGTEIGTATVTIAANDAPLSDDATLEVLTLSGIDIGVFDAAATDYAADVDHEVDETTVTATPSDAAADVVIKDADGSTAGTTRTTRLAAGANAVGVEVTAEDGIATQTYGVTVTRAAAATATWGDRLAEQDIDLSHADRPRGLWSDGETLWTADWDNGTVLAYALADGSRAASKDFTLGAFLASALWSDGETLWAADHDGGVYAYRLGDGERLADDDLDGDVMADAGNDRPTGLWSDGATLWVADYSDAHIYAYRLSDGARQEGKEFTLRTAGDDDVAYIRPFGLFSDGETVLATDWLRGTVRGYALGDGARRADRDIGEVASANGYAAGLWSDGATLWVVDELDRKGVAYAVPGLRTPPLSTGSLIGDLQSRATVVPGATAAGPPVSIPDPGLRGRIAAALGKADAEPIGVHELGALVVLDARNAAVADLTGLEHAVNLEGLDLGHNPVADVRSLTSLTALRRLNLDGAAVDPWELAAVRGLRALSLRSNGLGDVSALSSMQGLSVLDLADNRIDDLTAVGALRNLVLLDVSDNRVTDLSPLAALRSLSELHVRGNRIEDFSPLGGLSALEALRADGYPVEDLSGHRLTEGLRSVDLDGDASAERVP